MVLFSISFLYIYRTREYHFKRVGQAIPLGHGGYQGGFLGYKAILQALNIFDIVLGIIAVPRTLAERRKGRGNVGQQRY
jgi:hypothetical protein